MTKKTYTDECLERADGATDEPWLAQSIAHILKLADTDSVSSPESYRINGEFIAHARTHVSELARRLQKACLNLRSAAEAINGYSDKMRDPYAKALIELAEELEAPLGKKE